MRKRFEALIAAFSLFAAAASTNAQLPTPLSRAGINLIPCPQQVRLAGPDCTLRGPLTVVLDQSADGAEASFAAEELCRGLSKDWGLDCRVAEAAAGGQTVRLSLEGAPEKVGPQGYVLESSPQGVTIRANTAQGLFYGVQTLLQCVVQRRESPAVPGLTIEDWPDISERAVHYDTKHFQEKADYVEGFIRTLAHYKVNMLIWEWEDKFAYRSHPEIGAPGAFGPEQMQAFTRLAAQYHIQLVPLVQGLGHVSYILKWPQYHDLREIPASNWEICPLKEDSYRLLFDLWDEAIAATPGSRYLHVGTDETWELGTGTACGCAEKARRIGRYGLMQLFLHRVAEHAAGQGRQVMSWGGGFRPEEKTTPPAGLITFGEDPAQDRPARQAGYPLYFYDPNPGIEHLFLPYLYRLDDKGHEVPGCLEVSAKAVAAAARSGLYDGIVATSWNCSGVHNQGWMLRYITAAEYAWSGGQPGWDEFRERFFTNYYGPRSVDVEELYGLLSRGSYFYMDSFERRVWHWGEVGKTHLPDLPRDDLEYDPFWNTRYRERVEKARAIIPQMRRARAICRLNMQAGAANSYDFELFGCLADLFEHTARVYLTLARLERTVGAASELHFADHAAARGKLIAAVNMLQQSLDSRAALYARIKATWEESQLPKGLSTPEKKYLHARDRQHNFANRRPDLSFMLYDEEKLGLEDYLAKLKAYIDWYGRTWPDALSDAQGKAAAGEDMEEDDDL